MADEKCVSVQYDLKKIFEKSYAKSVRKEMQDTIESLVSKTTGLGYDKNCKNSWLPFYHGE